MSTVNKVSSELARDKERALLASNVDINDVVRVAEDGGSGAVSFPTLLNRPAMLTNWVLKKFSTGADERIAQDMGELMISDPAAFSAKYLQDATPSRIKQITNLLMERYGNPYVSVAPSALVSQEAR